MAFTVGDRVEQQAQSTQRPARAGVVEEVVREDPAPRYRIRWNHGRESIYAPAAGALHGLYTVRSLPREDCETVLMQCRRLGRRLPLAALPTWGATETDYGHDAGASELLRGQTARSPRAPLQDRCRGGGGDRQAGSDPGDRERHDCRRPAETDRDRASRTRTKCSRLAAPRQPARPATEADRWA